MRGIGPSDTHSSVRMYLYYNQQSADHSIELNKECATVNNSVSPGYVATGRVVCLHEHGAFSNRAECACCTNNVHWWIKLGKPATVQHTSGNRYMHDLKGVLKLKQSSDRNLDF